jgi:hypothetical protein
MRRARFRRASVRALGDRCSIKTSDLDITYMNIGGFAFSDLASHIFLAKCGVRNFAVFPVSCFVGFSFLCS